MLCIFAVSPFLFLFLPIFFSLFTSLFYLV